MNLLIDKSFISCFRSENLLRESVKNTLWLGEKAYLLLDFPKSQKIDQWFY